MTLPSVFTGCLGMALASLAVPAAAAAHPAPATRLVTCASGSCLLVSGRRAHAAAPVRINGHAVAVEGARHWRASLPVETVRAWSAPFARSIAVAAGAESAEAELPIGLLGHVTNLAALVVRAR